MLDERVLSTNENTEGVLTVDELNIPNTSLKVVNINGELFEEFLKKVHLVNSSQSYLVPGNTTVIGVRLFCLQFLNSLKITSFYNIVVCVNFVAY